MIRDLEKNSLLGNTEQERGFGVFFHLDGRTEERCLSQEVWEVLTVNEWLSVPSANEEAGGLTLSVVLEGKEKHCSGEEWKREDCMGIVQPSSPKTSGSEWTWAALCEMRQMGKDDCLKFFTDL